MPDRSGVFSPPHRALSVGILVSISAIATEGMAVATVMPTAATELGGLDGYGWAFSAFMLMSLIGAIAAGHAADRGSVTGPARLGFATFAAGLVVAGLAPSWPVLLLGRGLQGFGGGSLGAVAYMAVARGYPESLRPRLLALLSSAWVVPALLGPAVAGQVAEHSSWRLVFLGILPLVAGGAMMLVSALARLPASTSEPGSNDGRRLITAVRLAAGVGLMLWAAGWSSLGPGLLLGALGAALAVPALRSLLPAGTFTASPGVPGAVAIRGLLAFGFFGCEALIPLGLATVRELPPSAVGLALTAGALMWVAGSWLQDRDEARTAGAVGQRAVRVRAGLVLVLLGIGAVGAVILSESLPVALAVAAWGVAGLGMGLAYPGSTLVALGAPSAQAGLAAASLQVAETVGVAAGAGAGGTLIAVAAHLDRGLSVGLGWAFVMLAGAIVLALVPAIRLVQEAPRRPEDLRRPPRFARSPSGPGRATQAEPPMRAEVPTAQPISTAEQRAAEIPTAKRLSTAEHGAAEVPTANLAKLSSSAERRVGASNATPSANDGKLLAGSHVVSGWDESSPGELSDV